MLTHFYCKHFYWSSNKCGVCVSASCLSVNLEWINMYKCTLYVDSKSKVSRLRSGARIESKLGSKNNP